MANRNTKSVSATLNEHLSSVIDGEAGDFEQRRVLDELGSNDALREKVSNYSLIGATMRSSATQAPIADSSFLSGIHDQIDSGIFSNTSLNEFLSAVLDDEADDFEQKKVFDELQEDKALRQKVLAYSLIGETLRIGNAPVVIADSGFLSDVHDKILSEEAYSNVTLIEKSAEVTSIKATSWVKPVGGFAVAASVAAIAFIGFQNYQSPNDSGLLTASLNSNTASKNILVADNASLMTPDPVQQAQIIHDDIASIANSYRHADNKTRMLLKRYVDSHMKQASLSAFVPSVRTIAYTD